jgi:ABC-type transporter Mla subunit MlaD
MSEKASQFRIGLFVTLGVAIVLAALFLFGIKSAFEPTYMFETYVTGDVDGLSVGSVVKLRGVSVGKVKEIGFSWNLYRVGQPTCVVVRCEVRQAVSPEQWRTDFASQTEGLIAGGLRAVIQTEGITGSAIVALQTMDPKKYPPLKVPWKPKYWYVPSAPSQLGRLLASVDRTLANLEKLDVAALGHNLNQVLVSADAALKKIGELDVKGISGNANKALGDADGAVLEIKGLAEDARRDLQAMKLEAVGTDADTLLKNLDARLALLIEKLSAIDVRSLNDTLAGTRDAARSLNEALEELKRYPSGFLFGKAPAPVPVLEEEKK